MKKRNILLFTCLGLLWYCGAGLADDGINDIVGNMLSPIQGTIGIIRFIVGITGSALIIFSLIKLKEYWQQTTETGLATILMLLAVGLALIGLIFLPTFQ